VRFRDGAAFSDVVIVDVDLIVDQRVDLDGDDDLDSIVDFDVDRRRASRLVDETTWTPEPWGVARRRTPARELTGAAARLGPEPRPPNNHLGLRGRRVRPHPLADAPASRVDVSRSRPDETSSPIGA
jgi:hypothetical protein